MYLMHSFTDQVISKVHFPELLGLLQPVTKQWREIGLALLVKQQVLDDLENNPELVKEGPEGFLRETLNEVETLTVRRLVDVLRSIQEEETACVLEGHYFNERGLWRICFIYVLLQSLLPLSFKGTKVNEDITTLAQSFESLKSSVVKELNAVNVTVKGLHEVVVGVYPDGAIPKKLMMEMEAASSSHDFFAIITRHGMWNCINYHLLESIVPRDNQLQKKLEQHKRRVVEFAQNTPVLDYIDICSMKASEKTANILPFDQYAPDPVMFAPFQLKLKLSAENQSLTDILALQNHMMKQFSFFPPTLLLGTVSRGSIVITLHFPRVEMKRVCSLAKSSGEFFKEHAVEGANIDNQFQYQQTISQYDEVIPTPLSLYCSYLLYHSSRSDQVAVNYKLVPTLVNFLEKEV